MTQPMKTPSFSGTCNIPPSALFLRMFRHFIHNKNVMHRKVYGNDYQSIMECKLRLTGASIPLTAV